MRRKMIFFSLGLVLALGGLVPSMAVAAPPTTETIHEDFDITEFDALCTGAVVPIQITGKSVFHITEFEDGRYHVTGTQVGTFTATDAGITYTGRFTVWFGENSNSKTFNGTFTFSATGKGSDGSKIRLSGVAHFSVNANGEVTSSFDRFTVTC